MSNPVIAAFNNHFEEFVTDIQRVFPEDEDIATAKLALQKLRKANPRLILISFKQYVLEPYAQQIDDGDISFFIKNDYSSVIGDNRLILDKIEALRGPVSKMKNEELEKVVGYLRNLKQLAKLYN
jgi:hypothetical protein